MYCFVVFCLIAFGAYSVESTKTVLPILGFFPWAPSNQFWPEGTSCIPAVLQAVDEINRNEYVPGYNLSLKYFPSDGCTVTEALKQYIDGVVHEANPPIALIAPGCSNAALKIASLTSGPGREIVQMSYGATNPSLSNVKAYPYFFRTVPNQLDLAQALSAFVQRHNWTRITALYQSVSTNSILRSTALNFRSALPRSTEFLLYRIQENSPEEIELILNQIKSSNSRIIFAFAYPDILKHILSIAQQVRMNSNKYVWIFPEQGKPWCEGLAANITNLVQARVFQTHYSIRPASQASVLPSGTTVNETLLLLESRRQEFLKEFKAKYKVSFGNSNYSWAAYDAMWALAIGLRSMQERNISLHEYHYNPLLVSRTLQDILQTEVAFEGMSGNISFATRSVKVPVVMQLVNSTNCTPHTTFVYNYGNFSPVGDVDPPLPSDRFEGKKFRIPVEAFSILMLSTAFLIIINSVLALINVSYRNHRIVRSTSPLLNIFIFSAHYALLLFLVIISVINFFPELEDLYYDLACNLLSWLLSVGFSLLLGTLFVKYFRLSLIFAIKYKTSARNKLSDRLLMTCIVLIVVVADVIPMSILTVVSPLRRDTMTVQTENIDTIDVSELNISWCSTRFLTQHGYDNNIFLFLIVWILLVKGIISAFLLWSAFRLRNITVYKDLFNDSGSVFTFMMLELITLILCTALLCLPVSSAMDLVNVRYYTLACGVVVTLGSSIVILFYYKYRKLFSISKCRRYISSKKQEMSPESLNSPSTISPWNRRYSRPSVLSLLSASSISSRSPRNSVNSVRFSPSPPEIAYYWPNSPRRKRPSSISTMASSPRLIIDPYFS